MEEEDDGWTEEDGRTEELQNWTEVDDTEEKWRNE